MPIGFDRGILMMHLSLPLGLVMGLSPFFGLVDGAAEREPVVIAAKDQATSFDAPARICIYADVKSELPSLLGNRHSAELGSMKQGPSAFTSQIEQALTESLITARISLHDSRGAGIIRTYANEWQARLDCAKFPNATYANVVLSTNSRGRPYRINASISQNDTTIEQHFERDALPELDEFLKRQGPYVESQGTIPLRLGIGWSVNGDTRITMRRLLGKIRWRGPHD